MIELHPSRLPSLMSCSQSRRVEISVSDDTSAADLGSAAHAALAAFGNTGSVIDFEYLAKTFGVAGKENEIETLFEIGKPWLDNIIAASQLSGSHTTIETRLDYWIATTSDVRAGLYREEIRVVGTIDVLTVNFDDGTSTLIDWKTGYKDRDHFWQMVGYALLVFARFEKIDEVTAMVGWLRDREIESYTFRRSEIEQYENRIVRALDSDEYTTGPHCLVCSRRHDCEARNFVVRSTINAIEKGAGDTAIAFEEMTPSERGNWYTRIRLAEQAIATLKGAIRKLVEDGESVTTDGGTKELTLDESVRKKVKAFESWQFLCDLLGEDIRDVAEIGKGKLDAAIKKQAKRDGVKQAALLRDVYTELDRLGAIERSTTYTLREKRITGERDDRDEAGS